VPVRVTMSIVTRQVDGPRRHKTATIDASFLKCRKTGTVGSMSTCGARVREVLHSRLASRKGGEVIITLSGYKDKA